jgi:GNAT superfamily N-acetyltransferase
MRRNWHTQRGEGLKVRSFEINDATRCCEIINSCIGSMDGLNEPARDYLRSKNSPESLAEELGRYCTVVFEENGKILSLGSLAGNEIKRMYVHPEAKAQGIGSTILHWLEKEAKRVGLRKLVTRSSPSAEPFYERHGFKRLGDESLLRGEAVFQFVIMEKEL